jgi:hypothetical protein
MPNSTDSISLHEVIRVTFAVLAAIVAWLIKTGFSQLLYKIQQLDNALKAHSERISSLEIKLARASHCGGSSGIGDDTQEMVGVSTDHHGKAVTDG